MDRTGEKIIRIFKKNLLVLFGILACFHAVAQSETDSLQKVLAKLKDDSTKVNTLLSAGKTYLSTTPQQAIVYAKSARDLAEKIGYQKGLANSFKTIGIANYMQTNYVESIESYEKALSIFRSLKDSVGVANILSNEGAVYFNKSDDARALELYLQALKISEKVGDTLRIGTSLSNIGAVYFNKPGTRDKALEYYLKALPFCEAAGDKDAIGTNTVNIGEIYLAKGDDKAALTYFLQSLKAYEGSENVPYSLNDIGKVYAKRTEYDKAIDYHQQAFAIAKKLDAKLDMAQSLLGVADSYFAQGNTTEAIHYYQLAQKIAAGISNVNYELENAYKGLALSYARVKDYNKAYQFQVLLSSTKDSLYTSDADKKLSSLQFNFDIQNKQSQIDLLTKDKALQYVELRRQKFTKNALSVGLLMLLVIAFIIFRNYRIKVKTNRLLDSQKLEIESLLLNILPAEVARELQQNGQATPRYYESVSVLFTDFKSFTNIADSLPPQKIVAELSECFTGFDDIIEKYNLERIKTIGDSYMCAGGIPTVNQDHPVNIVKAALEILAYMEETNKKIVATYGIPLEIRIGIHTGPVVAGVVGKKKYAYDIWGSTVNIASRMESSGQSGLINISAALFEMVKHEFDCTYRGKVHAKNVGEIDMFFVTNPKNETVTAMPG